MRARCEEWWINRNKNHRRGTGPTLLRLLILRLFRFVHICYLSLVIILRSKLLSEGLTHTTYQSHIIPSNSSLLEDFTVFQSHLKTKALVLIWRFPNMGVPPNHVPPLWETSILSSIKSIWNRDPNWPMARTARSRGPKTSRDKWRNAWVFAHFCQCYPMLVLNGSNNVKRSQYFTMNLRAVFK